MSKSLDIADLMKKHVLTVQPVAFYSGTSRPVVERWLENGDLGFFVLPHTSTRKRQRRIFKLELDAFLTKIYQKKEKRMVKSPRQS